MLPLENIVNSQVQAPILPETKDVTYFPSTKRVTGADAPPPPTVRKWLGSLAGASSLDAARSACKDPLLLGHVEQRRLRPTEPSALPLRLTDATNFLEIKSSTRACRLGEAVVGPRQAGQEQAAGVLRGLRRELRFQAGAGARAVLTTCTARPAHAT